MRQSLWYPGAKNEFSPGFKGNEKLEIDKKVSFLSCLYCLGFHLNLSSWIFWYTSLACHVFWLCPFAVWHFGLKIYHTLTIVYLFFLVHILKRKCGQPIMNCFSWVGQKVCLGFSITSYGKIWRNFLCQPNIFMLCC